VKVDTAKVRCLVKEVEAVVDEGFCHFVLVLLPPGKLVPGEDAGVLVEARTFGKPSQRALDGRYSRLKFLVCETFFVRACDGE